MFTISSECLSCGACEPECPAGAISEVGSKFEISDACLDCGACVPACPVDAISG